MRLPLAFALLIALGAPSSIHAEPMNAELTRIHDILDRGELKRARGLFKAYLAAHPGSQAAREGYEEAGGDPASLGLAGTAPAGAAKEDAVAPAPAADNASEAAMAAPAAAAVQASPTAPAVDGPGWRQRLGAKLARLGRASLVLVAILGILALIGLLGWGFLHLARWHQARHHEAMLALAAQRRADGEWPLDLYIELRFFTPYWGFSADSEQITNDALRRLNEQGWACAKVFRQNRLLPSVPSTKLIVIWLISGFSLGFLNYYSGPVLWLRRT